MSRAKYPRRLKDIVADVCRIAGMNEALEQYRMLQVWDSVVGDAVAKVTKVERISEGDLYIRVSSSTWRMELNFRKKEIIEKINKATGKEIVKTVIFR